MTGITLLMMVTTGFLNATLHDPDQTLIVPSLTIYWPPLLDAYLANLVLSQTPDTDETSRTFLAAMHRGEVIPTWIFAATDGEDAEAQARRNRGR